MRWGLFNIKIRSNRITSAKTTAVNGAITTENFAYNKIGNIVSSGAGVYLYEGATSVVAGTAFANPHAPTKIANAALTYDKKGNVLTYSNQTYTWDHANRLTRIVDTGTSGTPGTATPRTTNYLYDHNNSRVRSQSGATTTLYISDSYDTTLVNVGTPQQTTTNHTLNIYANNQHIATLVTDGTLPQSPTNPTVLYIHNDHLNSTARTTNSLGNLIQTFDYTTFGTPRVSASTLPQGSYTESRQYIGEEYDSDTKLNYLNARYYDSVRGQFLSQDPVFWEIGKTDDGKKIIVDPQSQNSYSYARNSPVVNKDPEGRYWETAFDLAMLAWSVSDFKENPGLWNGLAVVADGAGFVLPIPAVVGGLRYGDDAYRGLRIAKDAAKTFNWGNPASLVKHTLDHAADFGLKKTDYAGYAKAANNFLSEAETAIRRGSKNIESFVDPNGRTLLFNKKTSTFGIKNADGTTATAYKPKGGDHKKALAYWNKQKVRYNSKK